MITIFADSITERLKYTLSLIFDDRGIDWQLVDDEESFKNNENPKLVYSSNVILSHFPYLLSSSLLFETEIREVFPQKVEWNDVEILSFNQIPDLLASIFYIASLYDDYLSKERDKHGRNIGKKSLLYRLGWIDKCVIEHWSEAFIQFIENANEVKIQQKEIPFKIIPTFDIDVAYAYKNRDFQREFLSKIRDVLKGNKQRIQERREVIKEGKRDPYDTYSLIQEISEKKYDVKVFWLLGDYGKYDKNISHHNQKQRELIQLVDTFSEIGLHPSYLSNQSLKRVQEEKHRLEKILQHQIKNTRQHFLKVELPQTFRTLLKAGFSDDYSLAYADAVGFRAGISRPFFWFDLKGNQISKLRLHPISYMDGTLKEYMDLSIEEAIFWVKKLKKEVKRFGGEFIPLWHNDTIGNYGKWEGWKDVLDKSIEL